MTSHECHEVSNHRPLECLFNTLFRLTTTKHQRPTAPAICQGNRPVPGRFPSLMASNVETWWRHQMETFSALVVICAGKSPVPGEFLAQRPVTRSFNVFFDLRLNKRLSTQSWGWWFETLWCPLWRHRNERFHIMTSPWTCGGCSYNIGLVYLIWFRYEME